MDALLAHPDRFIRAFTEHLLSYALGRGLELGDKPSIDRIVQRVTADGGRFSTVIVEVAKSRPFLHKTNQRQHEPVVPRSAAEAPKEAGKKTGEKR